MGDVIKKISAFTNKFKVLDAIAKRIVEGMANATGEKVNEETAASRLAICEQCSYFQQEYRKCIACLCFMDIKTKFDKIQTPMGIKKVECPGNFWKS